jgi:hypothetical protein
MGFVLEAAGWTGGGASKQHAIIRFAGPAHRRRVG